MFAMRMTGMLQVEKLFYQVSFWYIDAETMKFGKLRIGIVAGCQNDDVAVPVALCEEVTVFQYNVHRYKAMNKVVWIVCLVLTERTEGRDFHHGHHRLKQLSESHCGECIALYYCHFRHLFASHSFHHFFIHLCLFYFC